MRRVGSFLALTFGITWTLAGVAALFGVRTSSGTPFLVLAALCMLCPAIAAMIQQRWIDKAPWAELGLGLRSMRWKALAFVGLVSLLFVPCAFLVVHIGADHLALSGFGEVSVSDTRLRIAINDMLAASGGGSMNTLTDVVVNSCPAWGVLVVFQLSALLAASTVSLPFMLGEELGWRGYLFQQLRQWPGWKRSLFTGVVWGLWHAPLIAMGHNYPGYPVWGIGLMVLFCTVAAVLFDHARARSGTVWGPCLLHGVVNGSAGVFGFFAWGGHPLIGSIVGLAGCVALGVLIAVVLLVDKAYRRDFLRGGLA